MYCLKCGTDNKENSEFCSQCGSRLKVAGNNSKTKTKFFTGHILNISSVAIPIIMYIAMLIAVPAEEQSNDGNTHISVTADISGDLLGIVMIIGLVIFAIGLVVYFIESVKLKTVLSFVYLILAVGDLIFLFMTMAAYVLATCGMGSVILIPGILQIVAGTKFVFASKELSE